MDWAHFQTKGWAPIEETDALLNWCSEIRPHAEARINDPELRSEWLRSGGTWFVGANVLGNTEFAQIDDSSPLPIHLRGILDQIIGVEGSDVGPGQVSTCWPKYPTQDEEETDASFRFRQKRDAAHLDGLKAEGATRDRYMREFHSAILGIPLQDAEQGAAPFVIYEGSHHIIADMLANAYSGIDSEDWADVAVTGAYTAARRKVFDICKRVEVTADLGGAYIAHRFAIHGMAPWAGPNGPKRTVLYFRPYWNADLKGWLAG